MKNTYFFLGLFALAILSSCSSLFTKKVSIDNPSDLDLTVVVDGTEYLIPAYSSELVELPKGEHAVVASSDGQEIFNETVSVTDNGILNVTLATYVVWKDLYLEDLDDYASYAASALDNKDHEVNNNVYEEVDFVVFENMSFIGEDWDYGIDEEWPMEVDISSGNYVVKSKVYRLEDIEAEWGFYGDFDFSEYSDEELNAFLDSLIQAEGWEDSIEVDANLAE
ncbi:MAG: hypothetical protein KDC82_08755 [Bacteroidetes bacterium]|nr:hypothetical protein [Bacteroidota bacterium]